MAQGFGIEAKRVDDHNQLDSAISWAVSASGPTFLEIKIDPNEIFPPLRSKIEQRKRDLMTQ